MLLDSNIIIYSGQTEHPEVREFLARDDSQVSAISIVEVLGYPNHTATNEARLRIFFASLPVLPVSIEVIERATVLRQHRRMSLGDAVIAGTALEHNLGLATRSVDDFRWITGLRLFNPCAATP